MNGADDEARRQAAAAMETARAQAARDLAAAQQAAARLAELTKPGDSQ